jgi:hypothetical protein
MQKWEYCAVVGIVRNERRLEPKFPAIFWFTPGGFRVTEIKGKENDMTATSIAELGEQGWEMVGVGTGYQGVSQTLYFKRPLA